MCFDLVKTISATSFRNFRARVFARRFKKRTQRRKGAENFPAKNFASLRLGVVLLSLADSYPVGAASAAIETRQDRGSSRFCWGAR
jgi:hypothetical protein